MMKSDHARNRTCFKSLDDVIVDSGLNQHDENILTEAMAMSDTCCVCLKETSDGFACKKCHKICIPPMTMLTKIFSCLYLGLKNMKILLKQFLYHS